MNANVNQVKEVSEVTEVNIKSLKHGLFETRTDIETALIKLEKAHTLLSHWTQEYEFNQKPDPRAALEWGRSLKDEPGRTALGSFSAKWYWEYNTIYSFVDMVFDYVIEAQELLNKAMEREV